MMILESMRAAVERFDELIRVNLMLQGQHRDTLRTALKGLVLAIHDVERDIDA